MKKITLLLVLLLGACGAPRPPLPPAPATGVLLQQLAEGRERWRQLDAAAEVGFTRAGRYIKVHQFLLIEAPDRLRIDVLSLFGQLALQLTVAEDALQVFVNTTVPGQYYQGPADDALLARFTRLPLRASDMVRLMLHDPPHAEGMQARVESLDDSYRLTLSDPLRDQQFYFDRQLQLQRCVYLRGGEVLLQVDYAQFDELDHFPRRVEIEMPLEQTRVALTLSEVKLNQPVKKGRFQLTPPPNAVPLQLPDLDPAAERS